MIKTKVKEYAQLLQDTRTDELGTIVDSLDGVYRENMRAAVFDVTVEQKIQRCGLDYVMINGDFNYLLEESVYVIAARDQMLRKNGKAMVEQYAKKLRNRLEGKELIFMLPFQQNGNFVRESFARIQPAGFVNLIVSEGSISGYLRKEAQKAKYMAQYQNRDY